MLLLPKTVGPFTLLRKLGTGGTSESYQGSLATEGGRKVVVRRILPYVLRDPARLALLEARVRDLLGVRHPFLVPVVDWVVDGDERFIVEEWVEGVDLDRVLTTCRSQGRPVPANVFLHLATQICNGLEALHGRPGRGSGSPNVLHLGLKPTSVFATREGKIILGGYGLARSPSALMTGGASAPVPTRMEYLSPEQTQPDQKLQPPSDVFSLGSLLFELLTLDPLFKADSNLQTIHQIRRAEVAAQLARVKQLMPGLDKVLYRALSLNPRHRYQRAFVLREDLRGLMANYSFATIVEDTRAFLAPLFGAAVPADSPEVGAPVEAPPASAPPPGSLLPDLDISDFEDAAPTRMSPPPAPMVEAPAVAPQRPQPPSFIRHEPEIVLTGPRPTLIPDASPTRPPLPPPAGGAAPPILPPVPQPAAAPAAPDDTHGYLASAALGLVAAVGASYVTSGEEEPETTRDHLPPPPAVPPPAVPPPTVPLSYVAPEPRDEDGAGALPHDDDTRGFLLARGAGAPSAPPPPLLEAPEPRPADPPQGAVPFDPPPRVPPPAPKVAPAPVLDLPASGSTRRDSSGGRSALQAPTPALPPPAKGKKGAAGKGNTKRGGPAGTSAGGAGVSPESSAERSMEGAEGAPPVTPAPRSPPTPAVAPPPIAALFDAPSPVAAPPPIAAPSPLAAAPLVAAAPSAAPPPRASSPAPRQMAAPIDEGPPPRPPSRAPVLLATAAFAAICMLACAGAGWWALGRFQAAGEVDPAAGRPELAATEAPAEGGPPEVTAGAPPEPSSDDDLLAEAATAEATAPPVAEASKAPAASGETRPGRVEREAPIAEPRAEPRAVAAAAPPAREPPSASRSNSNNNSSSSASTASAPPVSREPAARASAANSGRSAPPAVAVADAAPADPLEPESANLDEYSPKAAGGRLTSSDVMALEMVDIKDESYTRSRMLLVMNAQRKGEAEAQKRYIDQLLIRPENKYNPLILTDLARYYVNKGSYSQALETARLAERHWARLPSDLIFAKKAEIYEIQAASTQGLFYKSNDNMELLEQSIRAWEKYKGHVQSRSRTDLSQRADAELTKLEGIRARLQ